MRDQVAGLLTKEMDRKEFMRFIGVGAILVLGGGVIMNALSSLNSGTSLKGVKSVGAASPSSSYGYGSSPYGGVRQQ